MIEIPTALVDRLYLQAKAERWSVPRPRFAAALQASAERAAGADITRYLKSLHLEDLALACACAAGDEAAWEHFVREYRSPLYRSADALESGDRARELADSLYADLYGTGERDGERRSLLRYFHGRSSLATWLRAVLAQRHVDAVRSGRRLEPLPPDDGPVAVASSAPPPADPDRTRYLALIHRALKLAIGVLSARDRLRLGCYYAEQMTLAQTGRLLDEHEATVSRQLARTRRAIREAVERYLKREAGLLEAQVSRCFEYALEDAGPLNLGDIIGMDVNARKKSDSDRSI